MSEEEGMRDMSEYGSGGYVTLDDVRDNPWRVKIKSARIGILKRPVLKFERIDTEFTLNVTNVNIMIKHFGKYPKDWVGKVIELYAGETKFEGKPVESVLIRPIKSDGFEAHEEPPPEPSPGPPKINDDIPF
jgi:hypothetical protein